MAGSRDSGQFATVSMAEFCSLEVNSKKALSASTDPLGFACASEEYLWLPASRLEISAVRWILCSGAFECNGLCAHKLRSVHSSLQ